jgi:hypothetical protein
MMSEPASAPEIRASDADRERVGTVLQEHFGAGRLTLAEFEERMRAAYAARTWSQLEALIADLPAVPPDAGPAPVAQSGIDADRCLLILLFVLCPPVGIIWWLTNGCRRAAA